MRGLVQEPERMADGQHLSAGYGLPERGAGAKPGTKPGSAKASALLLPPRPAGPTTSTAGRPEGRNPGMGPGPGGGEQQPDGEGHTEEIQHVSGSTEIHPRGVMPVCSYRRLRPFLEPKMR